MPAQTLATVVTGRERLSHRFPLAEASAALALVGGRATSPERPVKVVLDLHRQ